VWEAQNLPRSTAKPVANSIDEHASRNGAETPDSISTKTWFATDALDAAFAAVAESSSAEQATGVDPFWVLFGGAVLAGGGLAMVSSEADAEKKRTDRQNEKK
jgi:hypothetical protein